MPNAQPGLVVMFGSGEALPAAGKAHEFVARQLTDRPQIAVLETPAGFEPNSEYVAEKVAQFLRKRLQNYHPEIRVIPARKRGTPLSPDAPDVVAPLLDSNWVFLGPGSPTYAARQLRDSLAIELIAARHQLGAVLMLASSATLALSAHTLPVYEIYKVGEDLHWKEGVDYFGRFGLRLVVIPHWNNAEGGKHLDTSRCFMGRARFAALRPLLPDGVTIVGLDEHTALIMDLAAGVCRVMGNGRVTVQRGADIQRFVEGEPFELSVLGEWHLPERGAGVDTAVWQQAVQRETENAREAAPTAAVMALVEARASARAAQDWAAADRLRDEIEALGWSIKDTPDGPELAPTE